MFCVCGCGNVCEERRDYEMFSRKFLEKDIKTTVGSFGFEGEEGGSGLGNWYLHFGFEHFSILFPILFFLL